MTIVETNSHFQVHLHTSAKDFLDLVRDKLIEEEISANIILAHAESELQVEFAHAQHFIDREAAAEVSAEEARIPVERLETGGKLWLSLWSTATTTTQSSKLLIVLSCLDWKLGEYPIFVWSPKDARVVNSEAPSATTLLAQCLEHYVERERVFSVFGQAHLVESFAKKWTTITGSEEEIQPFYVALLSHCNRKTFQDGSMRSLPSGHHMREAQSGDLGAVARRCKEFTDDSFFPLSLAKAEVEASLLINEKNLWVYEVDGEVVTICAVTRTTPGVAGITKVFTTPRWRKNGFAERLVRMVTYEMLFDRRKDSVVLYVGKDNAAQHVYNRVGFVGLCGQAHDLVEDALEIGFKGTRRGHW